MSGSNAILRHGTRKYWLETWASDRYVECYLRWDQYLYRPYAKLHSGILTDAMGGGIEVLTRRWEFKWNAAMQRLVIGIWLLMLWVDLPKLGRK